MSKSLEEIVADMLDRFRSGNSIQVERAHITRDEFRGLLQDVRYLDLESHGRHQDCHSCDVARMLEKALEQLGNGLTG